MSIALTGLILLQLYWLRHDLRMREQQFGQNVMMALNSIVTKLEEKENQKIVVRHFMTSGDSTFTAGMNTDSLLQQLAIGAFPAEVSTQNVTNIPSPEIGEVKDRLQSQIEMLRQPVNLKRDQVVIPITRDTSYDIRIERDVEQKEVFAIQLASEEARFDSIARETEQRVASRIRRLNTMMQKFTFQITDRSNNIFNRVDTLILDSLVKSELQHHTIDLPYAYAIAKPDSASFIYVNRAKDSTALQSSNYRIPLFPGDFFKRNEELALSFNGKLNYLLLSMWPMLLASLVFTLAICIGFGYSMSIILRQKKLAEIKNDFINNMTHEFKTPIATIAIANESIRDPRVNGSPEKLEYYTSVIRDENQRMLGQVEHVLQMAQIDKGELALKKAQLDVSDVLQKAVQSAALSIRQREGEISLNTPDEPVITNADGNHLLNVFTNLIDNANKYSEEVPQINLSLKKIDNHILVTVSDKGIGMSKEVQKRIFETFYRASTGNIHNVKGFGLGLSYVKAIVEAHHGTIEVSSEPGRGSTFTINLPIN
jgi:two-component system phosphate regulon sensor histidine kinase PhoR